MDPLDRSVVIVEDDAFLRSLIANFLSTRGFEVHESASALDAIKLIHKVDPDALVLDIDLGGSLTGIDVANRIDPVQSGIGLVFLTSLSDFRFANTNVKTDFPKAAYLNKNLLTDPTIILDALNTVLAEESVAGFRQDKIQDRPLGSLTKSQIGVLQLVASGHTNQQISDQRGTSLEATEAMIARVWKVIGIDSSAPGNARVLAAREYLRAVGFNTNKDLSER